MNNKIIKYIFLSLIIWLIIVIWFKRYKVTINIPITNPWTNTGSISSWSNNTWEIITWNINRNHTKSILGSPINWINGDVLYETSFPQIKINKKVDNVKITFDINFTNYFEKYYQSYIQSNWYFFAFKFFLWNKDNGWFIDVFRNKNDGVGNSTNGDLNGAKLWQDISNWTQWIIWNEVKIAQPAGIYWFTRAYPTAYINSQVWKTIYIWWHLSSVKEKKWREFTKINQITIEYEGDEDAIEVVK